MFWYYVAPFTDDKWNILFEDQKKPHIYDSQDDALQAAHKAAKKNFEKHDQPSGVRVKEDGRWREDGTYGDDA